MVYVVRFLAVMSGSPLYIALCCGSGCGGVQGIGIRGLLKAEPQDYWRTENTVN